MPKIKPPVALRHCPWCRRKPALLEGYPHVCVVIDSTSAALYEGQLAVSTDKFLRD